MENILLTAIRISDLNARKHFDATKLKELIASVKEKGIIEPIIVRPAGKSATTGKKIVEVFEIVCGERRFRAAQAAGLKDIPAIVRELDDKQALEFQVVENLQREDVHPLEEAEGYESLMKKHGYKTAEDVAVKIGKSKGYVYGRLKLCELIPENRKLFYEGKFSPSVALLVARIPAHLQKEAAKKLLDGVEMDEIVSYREALQFIQHNLMLQLKDAPFDTKDKNLGRDGLSGACVDCPKRTGNQKELFADISSADVCTDPACFNLKKNAAVQRTLAKVKEDGKKVLSQEQCKEVFPREWDTSPKGNYVDLTETCWDDSKSRKFSQLAKAVKDTQVIYAVHPHKGTLVELITKTEADRIKKELGIKGRNVDNSEQKHDEAKRRLEEHIRKATIGKICDAIVEQVRKDKESSFLRLMANSVFKASNEATQRMFILRRDPTIKRDQLSDAVKKHLDVISDSELLGFCLELLMLAEAEWHAFGEAAPALCKHYGIDIKKIQEEAKKGFKKK